MYFWLCERAANIHTCANVSFPLISCKIGSKIKYFCVKSKKKKQHLNHSHFKTNMALRMKFQAHYDFTKILIISYNNAQIYPNVTVQYLKRYPFCPESMKNVRSYFGFPIKISILLKLKDLCTVWSKRF